MVQNDAEAFVGGDECGDADEPDGCREDSPPALCMAEDE